MEFIIKRMKGVTKRKASYPQSMESQVCLRSKKKKAALLIKECLSLSLHTPGTLAFGRVCIDIM